MKIVTTIDKKTGQVLASREFPNPKNAERLYEILSTYLDRKKVDIYIFDPDEEEDW